MALKAVFVGIDRHRSADVPELGGAKRDATTLWALFTDSVPGLAARLLVDEQATLSEVQDAVLGTLNAAEADDTVVLSFAGHGSPDGSLILYDTEPANLASTALSMTVLAEAFRSTKARVVLCILDCCFSGQAPARVLETAAKPRNAFALAGKRLSINEIASEKIVALTDPKRSQPRDLFDIWTLAEERDLDLQQLAPSIAEKLRFRNRTTDDLGDNFAKKEKLLKRTWGLRLDPQMANTPPFERFQTCRSALSECKSVRRCATATQTTNSLK